MEIALVSDIHGNRVALDAVREDMPAVDEVVCAGDVVGYNPWPAAAVEWVRSESIPTVMGNHDRAVATGDTPRFNDMALAGVEYAREVLADDQIDWLGSLPAVTTAVDGRVRIVHGHPDDPDRYVYAESVTASILDSEDLLVLGHTHVPFVREFEDGLVVNPGSVGQPRDGDPGAAYAVVDLDARTVEHHRVSYDVGAVIDAVEEAGLPRRIATRLAYGE
ncbi:metallophosphoesterase family protein [Halococcoides cellulosivorans]|uniref:Phosphoesterase n=1 Tax=Halococcoides cellulosivorans TaxID=1679096 RepID=A0A2R4X467_9EURY|nr:metallophosphoesterase family protein [Halococcoides cellulosivorans]AWB28594.1 metallophosphoesterase [Halococcoides cellulosivorans]